jgi:hypothetical protein
MAYRIPGRRRGRSGRRAFAGGGKRPMRISSASAEEADGRWRYKQLAETG